MPAAWSVCSPATRRAGTPPSAGIEIVADRDQISVSWSTGRTRSKRATSVACRRTVSGGNIALDVIDNGPGLRSRRAYEAVSSVHQTRLVGSRRHRSLPGHVGDVIQAHWRHYHPGRQYAFCATVRIELQGVILRARVGR